jgi:hypothetical protein
MKKILLFLPLLAFLAVSCQHAAQSPTTPSSSSQAKAVPAAFKNDAAPAGLGKYWYQGKAEINKYDLQQNRYNAVHQGEAIAIFVTEDFLTDKQVKNDNYNNPNSTPILKLNLIKRFTTGLYDYSIMSSTFTPTRVQDIPQTLKVTTSTQDWCGQTFMQFNYENGKYKSRTHSYFETEGDREEMLDYAILEDELMNRIRIAPDALPTGKIRIIPSATILRLRHMPTQAVEASASINDYSGKDFSGENLKVYSVNFPALNRVLEIVFQHEAPYLIEGWTDTYPSAFDRKARTTIAKRNKTILSPYWQKNAPEDEALRASLELQ